MFSTRRRFTDDERDRLAATIDAIYADFVAKVAQGRSRPVGEIEQIARGRVWTGRDALGIGLVDELGGLRTAVRIARERGGLPKTRRCGRRCTSPPLARLGRPRNSEDPRAQVSRVVAADVRARRGARPARCRRPADAVDHAALMGYVDVAGLATWHEVDGDGDPVVLLHGGFAGASSWAAQLPALRRCRISRVPARNGARMCTRPTSTGRSRTR